MSLYVRSGAVCLPCKPVHMLWLAAATTIYIPVLLSPVWSTMGRTSALLCPRGFEILDTKEWGTRGNSSVSLDVHFLRRSMMSITVPAIDDFLNVWQSEDRPETLKCHPPQLARD